LRSEYCASSRTLAFSQNAKKLVRSKGGVVKEVHDRRLSGARGFVMADKASGSGINAKFTSGRVPKIAEGRESDRSPSPKQLAIWIRIPML